MLLWELEFVMEPRNLQEALYEFPYHHLSWVDSSKVWRVGRFLWWGYEYLALLQIVSEIVVSYKFKRICDFGCGDGCLIKELISKNPDLQIIGVDISKRAISFAKAFLEGNEKVYFFSSLSDIDKELLPLDAVIAVEVLEHIPPTQLKLIFDEISSLLRPKGIFIVTVPTINIPLNPKHYQHFTLESLKSYAHDKFKLIEHRYVHRIGWRWEIIRRMVINRFFIANNRLWLQLATYLYKRFVMNADHKTGAHLIAIFQLID